MVTGRRSHLVPPLLLALVASAGLNAYLLRAERDRAAGPHGPGGQPPAAAADRSAVAPATDPRCPPLGRQQTAQMLKLLFARSNQQAQWNDQPADGDRDGPRRLADEATRREVLCRVGEVAARNDWNAKRDDLVASVRESLADEARQELEMDADAKRMAGALGLDDDQLRTLTDRYRDQRAARMGELQEALTADTVDFRAAFDALNSLYQDEDRLVGELFGDAARERLHDYEINKRATILAIAATYADLDWNQSINW